MFVQDRSEYIHALDVKEKRVPQWNLTSSSGIEGEVPFWEFYLLRLSCR